MRKAYEVKIYGSDGSFIRTMNTAERMSDFSFSSAINAGQTDCEIEMDRPFADDAYVQGQFAKVFCYDDLHQSGVCVFSGQITRVQRVYSAGIEKIQLTILGLASLLSNVLFRSAGLLSFTKNQAAGQTIKDIIDYFSTIYPNQLSYTGSTIETGPTVSIAFANMTCLDAMKQVGKSAGYFFSISPIGIVYFYAANPTATSHTPTLQKDIQAITVNEDGENIVNKYTLTYSGGSTVIQDVTSQTKYGIKEKYESDTSLNDLSTANIKANAYIARYKNPQKKISMTINGNYTFGTSKSIEDILPGETVTVRNSTYSISALKIAKIVYNPEEIRIELEEFDTLAKELLF